MGLDLRTRFDRDVRPLDARTVFEDRLPAALDARPDLVGTAVRTRPLRPLTLVVDDDAWSLVPATTRVELRRGRVADAIEWRLAGEALSEVVQDRLSPVGLHASGRLAVANGTLLDLLDWWLALRSVLDARPVHTPDAVRFTTADGGPLDLRRAFRLTDPVEDMAWFLAQAGFLHVTGVFTPAEMAAVSADMDAAASTYAPDDGHSWWARTAEGRRLVRMQAFDQRSPATAALLADERLRRIAALPGDGHRHRGAGRQNAIEALVKPIGVLEGISDVPWHKDCSLGRHSYDCCALTVGISVTGADAASGQLRVVAGSHRALVWPARRQPDVDLPEIPLPTATGDVTVHASCTLHMAEPPVVRERRVMYTSFALPDDGPAVSAGRQALVDAIREVAPRTVSQAPAR
jgi:hypothetical protein